MMKLGFTKKSLISAAGLAIVASVTLALAVLTYATPPPSFSFSVNPFTFDPFQTKLVSTEWMSGAGCPTDATINTTGAPPSSTFSDGACPTGSGDPNDQNNMGLVLVKTGPTANYAAAGARINGVKGITLTEIGYDIRIGSHCGAGAPRFNILTTTQKFYFLGCNSPSPDSNFSGTGWKRLRWGTGAGTVMAYHDGVTLEAIADSIQSIDIVFDEGQDTDPIGLAVLDNIDINGTLQGKP